MRLLVLFALLFGPLAQAQTMKVFRNTSLTYSELAGILNQPRWDSITFEGVNFRADQGTIHWADSVYGVFTLSRPIVIGKLNYLYFFKCNFSSSIFLKGLEGGEVGIEDCMSSAELIIENFNIHDLWTNRNQFRFMTIEHSSFEKFFIDAQYDDVTIVLYKMKVTNGPFEVIGNRMRIEKSIFTFAEDSRIENQGEGNAWTFVRDSRFEALDSAWIEFDQTGGQLQLIRNTFTGGVALTGAGDRITWNLVDNDFRQHVGFRSTADIGPASYINFSEIYGGKALGWKFNELQNGQEFFDGMGDQIAQERYYSMLLRLHKTFHDFYLQGGDILTANGIYVRIKDLETRHLKHQYEQLPSFDLWIRISLNKLLKFYTRYGTEPARAIIISIWVVFWFGIFYLFFPSSWDVTAKSKLLQDFKDLRNVNTGRFRKTLRLLVNAAVALLNAFTLSLNAFVTLGFGEIPTRGVARYVTIAEGFLGWFLLTLFSVALISQSSF
jgi:hypothetical protein